VLPSKERAHWSKKKGSDRGGPARTTLGEENYGSREKKNLRGGTSSIPQTTVSEKREGKPVGENLGWKMPTTRGGD